MGAEVAGGDGEHGRSQSGTEAGYAARPPAAAGLTCGCSHGRAAAAPGSDANQGLRRTHPITEDAEGAAPRSQARSSTRATDGMMKPQPREGTAYRESLYS